MMMMMHSFIQQCNAIFYELGLLEVLWHVIHHNKQVIEDIVVYAFQMSF